MEEITLRNGRRLTLEAVGPGDLEALLELGRRSAPDDLRLRFFSYVKPVEGSLATRLTHPDPRHEVALAARDRNETNSPGDILAMIRLIDSAHDPSMAEFAILVRSDQQRQGLGRQLMLAVLQIARERGLRRVEGDVLAENRPMLNLVRALGGHVRAHGPEPGVLHVAFEPIESD